MSITLLSLWALGPRPSFVAAWEEPELPAERRWEKQKGGGRRKKGGRGKARKKSEL